MLKSLNIILEGWGTQKDFKQASHINKFDGLEKALERQLDKEWIGGDD